MRKTKIDNDQMMLGMWRQLGFYYDFDDRLDINQWRFYGSKNGLQNLIKILENYTNDTRNELLSEHEHFGPYGYLKIMTWNKPIITQDYFAGSIQDLKSLKQIISEKLIMTLPGQTFTIDQYYGIDNTVTVKFFVMADNFDPVSMDELIVSGRQEIVNQNLITKHHGKKAAHNLLAAAIQVFRRK
jgi:hypothetical protein